ncbi:TPA: methyltransferase domain-containing protein [Vibrio vulnificus]|nr:methyltransferase domain-containing protein [Vibrio vulnificus]HDY8123305.1 methyltransferase domain-containing protein [Vibrio vulnificus]
MDKNTENWRQYYEKALSRPHSKRTEFAVRLNESNLKVATDCGCGTGSDIDYLSGQNYKVFGFDVNPDSITICNDRFGSNPQINIEQSSFESFRYPKSGVVIANNSLFFAVPTVFSTIWHNIESSLVVGGVFAGDFMGYKDSWASGFRVPTSPFTESEIRAMLTNFDIVSWSERDELGQTTIGATKHWHIYSVVAVKRT